MFWAAILIATLVAVPASVNINEQYGDGATLSDVMQQETSGEVISVSQK